MIGTRIATTSLAEMHALAYQGIRIADSYPQLRDMLRQKFGDSYVLLFAEPVEDKSQGTIDWYTPVQGEARRLDSLPPEQQDAARAALAHMGKDIEQYADSLKSSGNPLTVTRGNILQLAVKYPGEESLYVVGDQPVIICWGFGPGTPGVEPQDLSRLTAPIRTPKRPSVPEIRPGAAPAAGAQSAAAPAREAVAPVAPVPAFAWWRWILPFLLLLFLLFLLLTGFGGLPAISGYTLFRLPFFGIADSEAQKSALESEISLMRRQAADLAAQCAPVQPRAEELVLPERLERPDFLQGRWVCDTGLINNRTGEPVVVEFAFDAQGAGEGVVHEANDDCAGAAQATVRDGELRIGLEPQRCRKTPGVYGRLQILCHSSAARKTLCTGTNEDGTTWDATFYKAR